MPYTFIGTKILHIDDDTAFLKNTKAMFATRSINIHGVTNGDEAVHILKDHYYDYDLVIIDLAMPDKDGIRVYEEIRKINPKIPVFFASAHFGEDNWERKLNDLEEDIKQIEKPFPIVISKDFKKIEKMIEKERLRYKEELLAPFKYSLDKFLNLSNEDMDQVFQDAFEVNFPFVEIYFEQNPNTDWVVIASGPGNIISFGKSIDEPFEEELMKIANEFNVPVFTYSKPKVVEQIINWSHKPSMSNPGDYYPTVLFEFDDPPGETIYCDLDTGSFYSFISYEVLSSKRIINRRMIWTIGSAILWGVKYHYYNDTLICRIVGNSNKVDIRLRYQAVKNWFRSPLVKHFQNRDGLIGREMILYNKVKLLLNGGNRETDIIT